MADYYVLDVEREVIPTAEQVANGKKGRKAYRVVFHIPIPVENNAAGIPLRSCVTQYRGTSSPVPWLDAAEQTKLTTGAVSAWPETVEANHDTSTLEFRDLADARFNALKVSLLDTLRARLERWGFDRTVP